jgi:hypothetical protein
VEDCKEFHHKLLHKSSQQDKDSVKNEFTGVHHLSHSSEICYRLLPVKLSHNNYSVNTWAFLDDGSGMTMISRDIASQLNVSGPRASLCLSWTNGMTQRDNDSEIVSLEISSSFGGRKFHIQNVRTISQLNLPSPSLNLLESLKNYDHLKEISIPEADTLI